jgi:DNA-binding FadR family transcriptional regulator
VAGAGLLGTPPLAGPGNGKLAARIARQIEADVLERGWPVGESLGSEGELRQRYPVSRAVLREAVRLVEHHQVAKMRRGAQGGLFITEPDVGPAAQAAVIYLSYVDTRFDEFLQVRQSLEPLAARLAAEYITEDGIARLRASASIDAVEGAGHAPEFHSLLAELSGNPALRLFLDVLGRLTLNYGDAILRKDPRSYRRAEKQAKEAHAAIVDAVIAGDASMAERAATEHMKTVSAGFARVLAGGQLSGFASETGDFTWSADRESSTKLGESLAAHIHADISRRKLPAGTVIGNEPELLEKYRVSRAVLREAIRLLESHGAVQMRTGPQGGLIAAKPDAQASVETIALYLEYQKVRAEDLLIVREAIELGVVSSLVARDDVGDIANRLHHHCSGEANEAVIQDDPTSITKADMFHVDLAEAASNPVQTLFMRVLTELWGRHRATQHRSVFGREAAAEVQTAHKRILDAIGAGDANLAQHRMRRHLGALTTWWY